MGKTIPLGGGGAIANTLIFKGEINIAADFPTSGVVSEGFTYRIKATVTDNDAAKTNTGQSFTNEDEIAWNGTDWTIMGGGSATEIGLNSIHRSSNGQTHADVTSNTTAIALNTTHRSSDGIDHANVIANTLTLNPILYHRDIKWANKGDSVAADRRTLLTPNEMVVVINGTPYRLTSQSELDINATSGGVTGDGFWDQIGTDYRVAANRAGKDFYTYAVDPSSGSVPDIILSANSTVPDGYTANTSRKIGGFHCLCVSAGTISGHPLTGYLQGDILPRTVWDLIFRASNINGLTTNDGMFYEVGTNIWVGIYLPSGTGSNTSSTYGATITDTRNWMDFNDDFATLGVRSLHDHESQSAAAGSNEETNIAGSTDPGITGGHLDTASRRMISNGGGEDFCGVMNQWLLTPSARLDDGIAAGWYDLPGNMGSFYTYGDNKYGNTVLTAGGNWSYGANAGSRCRNAADSRWKASVAIGGRFAAESL